MYTLYVFTHCLCACVCVCLFVYVMAQSLMGLKTYQELKFFFIYIAVSQFRGSILQRLHLKTQCVTAVGSRLSYFESSFKCSQEILPSFPDFGGTNG